MLRKIFLACSLAASFAVSLAFTGGAAGETPAPASAPAPAPAPDKSPSAKDEAPSHQGHSGEYAQFKPFDADADAMADVDAALVAAQSTGKLPLLVLGGNWCHDSRGLAAKFSDPALAAIIEAHFLLVYVDVGRRDRNLDVAQRFGVEKIIGTPTIIVLSPQGELLNPASVHDWRNAADRTLEETREFLLSFVAE